MGEPKRLTRGARWVGRSGGSDGIARGKARWRWRVAVRVCAASRGRDPNGGVGSRHRGPWLEEVIPPAAEAAGEESARYG